MQTVTLTFVELYIESSVQCEYDSVELYDGADPGSAPLLGRYCGARRPPPLTANSSAVAVVFRSDVDVSEGRFALSWTFNRGQSQPCIVRATFKR